MLKKELILILLSINKIGRNTVNKLIQNSLPLSTDPHSILDFILDNISSHKFNLTIEDIIIAKNKSQNILDYCEKNNINIITILDKHFPLKLSTITNNPVIIFYKGNISCILNNKSISIVGTRYPTIEGKEVAKNLAQLFSKEDYIIISGLAHGIDYQAHISTINNHNKTLAVLPSGISNIYPPDHKVLCDEILYNDGCILSEYFPMESPYKNHFIERDRLQSALSLGVIVVECSTKSGTMHTVNFSMKQDKVICCFKFSDMNYHCRSGNVKLLQSKDTLMIDNNYNLSLIKNILENKLEKTNNMKLDLLSYKDQISFHL